MKIESGILPKFAAPMVHTEKLNFDITLGGGAVFFVLYHCFLSKVRGNLFFNPMYFSKLVFLMSFSETCSERLKDTNGCDIIITL